jgi:hypothetical protein
MNDIQGQEGDGFVMHEVLSLFWCLSYAVFHIIKEGVMVAGIFYLI